MRFKIDENLPDALLALLIENGHEATTVREQKLNGRPDSAVAEACRSERRTIITLDLDFADITAFPPEEYAGLVVLRLRDHSKAHIVATLRQFLPLLESEPLDGHLWIVEESRVRIWHRW